MYFYFDDYEVMRMITENNKNDAKSKTSTEWQ